MTRNKKNQTRSLKTNELAQVKGGRIVRIVVPPPPDPRDYQGQ